MTTAANRRMIRSGRNDGLPAQPLDAEDGLLASCMLAGGTAVAQAVAAGVTPEHFTDPIRKIIFAAILEIHRRGESVDIVTLPAELEQRRELEMAGGVENLMYLGNLVSTEAHAGSFIEKILEANNRGEILPVLQDAISTLRRGAPLAETVAALSASLDLYRQSGTEGVARILDPLRYDPAAEPPEQRVIYRAGKAVIATEGNIISIFAPSKSGKTAVALALAAAATGRQGDTLGFHSENPQGHAVIHFDSEQSPADHYAVSRIAFARVDTTASDWFRSYSLVTVPLITRRKLIRAEIVRARREHGGIHSVILDGVADFVADPNDPAEAFGFVEELHALAAEFKTVIVAVLHTNPGSGRDSVLKARGHLGSQLEREAESNLVLEKDSDGVTVIYSEKSRHAQIVKADGPRFRFCVEAQMHVSIQTARKAKDAEDREELIELAKDAYAETPANRLRWTDLRIALEKGAKCSERTAKNQIRNMRRLGILKEVPPRLLELCI